MSNVGIAGIHMYFPKLVVRQKDLEKFDGVSSGKYTIGLGLQEMAFCGNNEDVVSLALTATTGLLREYQINPASIGFLEVGSETLIDKSKSVKSELMTLFGDNKNIEGADVKHACYGGTQALFHAVDWIIANHEYDKRNAIVVMSDIAIYEKGAARPTGGAGAVALLITPNAPIVLDRGLRLAFGEATWDFYKPTRRENLEYPVVDGKDSLSCYLRCLIGCYAAYKKRAFKVRQEEICLNNFDAIMLHCPYVKLLEKAIGKMAFEDSKSGSYSHPSYDLLQEAASLTSKDIQKIEMEASSQIWTEKTNAFLDINRRIGNMYTPSLVAQVVAFLSKGSSHNRRLLCFAYGSGAQSAIFSMTTGEVTEELKKMEQICSRIVARLDERLTLTPEEYTAILDNREHLCQSDVPFSPTTYPVFPDTFVLTQIDSKYRRSYRQQDHMNNGHA